MSGEFWAGAGASLALAIFAGFRDWRRKRRVNLDKIGIIDWPTVQVLALFAAAVLASIAYKS